MNAIDQVKRITESGSMTLGQECRERMDLQGMVKITAFEDGKDEGEVVFEDHNLIVNGAKKVLSYLLSASPTNNRITILKLGTMGHGVDIFTPVAPTAGDTALNDPSPVSVSLGSYAYSPPGVENIVKFTFTLEKVDGNGAGTKTYTEAGLFTTAGVMFARETFPGLIKNNTRRIVFEWSIIF